MPAVLVAALLIFAACTKPTPPCDNSKTVDAVINAVAEELKEDLRALTSVLSGRELSDNEWRLRRSGMIISVNNIRQLSFDEESGQYECAGDLRIISSGSREDTPITYTYRLLEADELQATVSGM